MNIGVFILMTLFVYKLGQKPTLRLTNQKKPTRLKVKLTTIQSC